MTLLDYTRQYMQRRGIEIAKAAPDIISTTQGCSGLPSALLSRAGKVLRRELFFGNRAPLEGYGTCEICCLTFSSPEPDISAKGDALSSAGNFRLARFYPWRTTRARGNTDSGAPGEQDRASGLASNSYRLSLRLI